LERQKEASIRSFVYASTAAVYGIKDTPHHETDPLRPLEIYGASELFGETLVTLFHQQSGIKTAIVRFFNGFGPRETNPQVIPEILSQLSRGNRVELGDVRPRRDFIHTSDIASALRTMAVHNGYQIETFNVATGQGALVANIVTILSELLQKPLKIESRRSRKRKLERFYLVGDVTKIKEILEWQPCVSLEDGLRETLRSEGLLTLGQVAEAV